MPQEELFAFRYWKLLLYLKPDQLRRKQVNLPAGGALGANIVCPSAETEILQFL